MKASRIAAWAALALLASAVLARIPAAEAACPYYGIDTLGTYAVVADPSIVLLSQTQPVWSAFAVRPNAGEDWDLTLFQNGAPDPTCVSTVLAGSSQGGSVVDFVIGDYRYDPAGTYYARCYRFSGAGGSVVRWRESPQVMSVNAPTLFRSWNSSDVIETWNVQLTAGTTYTVNFAATLGLDAKVMLFRNPGASTYWAGRGAAVLTSTTATTYTPPSTDTYAVVIVNDNGGTGTVSLGIGTCTTPATLTSGTTVHTERGFDYFKFTQSFVYWSAVGVRSTVADYDVGTFGGTAGTWPTCLSDAKGASGGVGIVDFVIGDFNHTPTGSYYARTLDFSSATGADVEWDSGSNLLTVGAAAVARTSDATDVLEVWDVQLTAGQTYNFAFTPSGSNLHLLLFRNAGGGVYWSGRSGAQFDVTGCQTYTAPSSGFYGVVVVNETGDVSSYTLGINPATCPCTTPLASQVPAGPGSPDAWYRFTQIPVFWSVVGTRGVTNADDWDLNVGGSPSGNPAPTCVGNLLVSSGYGAGLVDVAVIDFNDTPRGTFFAQTHHYSGGALTGVMEWDATHGLLEHNGPMQSRSMLSNDLAHAWDAYLVGGQTYTLEFIPSDPTIKLLVFENAGGGSYAVNRAAAALTTSATIAYTPTVSGFHGFVIVNDGAVNGSYAIRFGSCTGATALTSDLTTIAPEGVNTYSFAQPASQWGAVGVRSTSVDWDIRVSATQTGPFPNCIGGSLASSSSGTIGGFVDFVTGDFFHNAPGTYYVEAKQFASGPLASAPVEWSSGQGEVLVNDNNAVARATDGTDVLQSWSVQLSAGVTYTIAFDHSGGANLHLLLFQNAGGAAYWTGRSGAVLDLAPGGGPFNYVAPSTGEFGLVVVNDDGGADSYTLTIKACTAPTALASGTVVLDVPEGLHSFAQATDYWTAVGVRSTTDWDIDVNSNPGGGLPGICQTGLLANSIGVGIVDFVVGDFNTGGNALGTYFTRPFRFSGGGIGTVEWDSGADQIAVGAAPVHRTTDANDVLEVWDVRLDAGHTYGVYFAHGGAADVRVLLFRNPGGAYWAGRTSNAFESTTHGSFTATVSGWHAVVVVNDNGAPGDYDVGISPTALDTPPADAPRVTALRSVLPNPARAGTSIEYTLSERAPVRVELLDLAGRVVAEVDHQTREAGVWQTRWNGRTSAGTRAAPGIYLVRLEVAGHTIGRRKVTVID